MSNERMDKGASMQVLGMRDVRESFWHGVAGEAGLAWWGTAKKGVMGRFLENAALKGVKMTYVMYGFFSFRPGLTFLARLAHYPA